MRRKRFSSVRSFESLEDRHMMAADIDLDNGILTAVGTDGHDQISFEAHPTNSQKLRVTIIDIPTGTLLEQKDVDRKDVQEIVVNALGGDDTIRNITDIRSRQFGGNGNDTLWGGGANDILDGGANDDYLHGSGGNDDLMGGIGNDTYSFNSFDYIQLGTDVIYENASVDTDLLTFSGMNAAINVNLAITTTQVVNSNLKLRFTSTTGIENVNGSLHSDTIRGNSRNNVLYGLAGNDWIYGEGGDDRLSGDSGNDYLYGGAGKDSLFGGTGGDELYGGADSDSLYGGTGNDRLFGEAGNDWLYGEADLDTLDGGADNDFLDGGQDGCLDQLKGGAGKDAFVKYKKRLLPLYDFEQSVLDYNSAVDTVITTYY